MSPVTTNSAQPAAGVIVLGLGYVGCVSAACLASLGNRVIGVDRDEYKVAAVNRGQSPFYEPDLDGLVSQGIAAGLLRQPPAWWRPYPRPISY